MLSDEVELGDYATEESDLSEYQHVPDIGSVSERLRSCLEVNLYKLCVGN